MRHTRAPSTTFDFAFVSTNASKQAMSRKIQRTTCEWDTCIGVPRVDLPTETDSQNQKKDAQRVAVVACQFCVHRRSTSSSMPLTNSQQMCISGSALATHPLAVSPLSRHISQTQLRTLGLNSEACVTYLSSCSPNQSAIPRDAPAWSRAVLHARQDDSATWNEALELV